MTSDSSLARSVNNLLRKLPRAADRRQVMERVLAVISDASGCESVGIRWRAEKDCPYYVTRGFGIDFVVLEGPLCARTAGDLVIRNPDGVPQLACMCGAVIEERTDPSLPYFTPDGSFWTNGTTDLLSKGPPIPESIQARNYCNSVGYESVALIPLRAGARVHGLLQLNSRLPGRFRPELIAEYERLGREIAAALVKHGPEQDR